MMLQSEFFNIEYELCLIMNGRSDIFLAREVYEEAANFFFSHFDRMAFVMEENKGLIH